MHSIPELFSDKFNVYMFDISGFLKLWFSVYKFSISGSFNVYFNN